MNRIKVQQGKHMVFKCVCYGITDDDTDWNQYNTACGHYGFLFRSKQEQCVIHLKAQAGTEEMVLDGQVEGQKNIMEYIKEGNLSWGTEED
jgi:hypothetical protein